MERQQASGGLQGVQKMLFGGQKEQMEGMEGKSTLPDSRCWPPSLRGEPPSPPGATVTRGPVVRVALHGAPLFRRLLLRCVLYDRTELLMRKQIYMSARRAKLGIRMLLGSSGLA